MVRIVLTIDADANCDDASRFARRRYVPPFEAPFVAHVAVALRPRVIDASDRHLAKHAYSSANRRDPFRYLKREA